MEITGKIIAVLEPRKGTSARTGSEWICGQYVLETVEQYPKRLFFEVFGADRIQQFNIQMGEMLNVSFDVDAREYNGRWFNSIRAFRVDRNIQAAPTAGAMPNVNAFGGVPAPSAPLPTSAPADLTAGAPFESSANSGDDLPF